MNKKEIKLYAGERNAILVTPEPVSKQGKEFDISMLGIDLSKVAPAKVNAFGEIVR